MAKHFALEHEPIEFILTVHFHNLFYCYGEEVIRAYLNKTHKSQLSCSVAVDLVMSNLNLTYGEKVVSDCWVSLFGGLNIEQKEVANG